MKLEIYGNERYEKACADLARQHEGLLERVKTDRQSYAGSLGWLYPRTWANQAILEQIKSIAAEIRANAQVLVLIGVGGSNNSARAMIKALGESGNIEIVYAGNTLSSYALHKVYEYVKDKSFYVHCIAKNFETLEPGSSFKLFRIIGTCRKNTLILLALAFSKKLYPPFVKIAETGLKGSQQLYTVALPIIQVAQTGVAICGIIPGICRKQLLLHILSSLQKGLDIQTRYRHRQ